MYVQGIFLSLGKGLLHILRSCSLHVAVRGSCAIIDSVAQKNRSRGLYLYSVSHSKIMPVVQVADIISFEDRKRELKNSGKIPGRIYRDNDIMESICNKGYSDSDISYIFRKEILEFDIRKIL